MSAYIPGFLDSKPLSGQGSSKDRFFCNHEFYFVIILPMQTVGVAKRRTCGKIIGQFREGFVINIDVFTVFTSFVSRIADCVFPS